MVVKELEMQVADWNKRIDKEPEKVALEVAISQFMLMWNINENLALIRDVITKKKE